MQLSKEEVADLLIVRLSGDLDLLHAPEFNSFFRDIYNEGSRIIILNLKQCRYIDSSGLGVLISILRFARELGGDLVLAEAEKLATTLKTTGLYEAFRVFSTENEAIDNLKP